MHLFCLHHAGGTTASFAGWRFVGVQVTKLGYRGIDFPSLGAAADALAERIELAPSPRLALYGHSMGAALAFEIGLRLQGTGRLEHVFLAAARPPSGTYDAGAAAAAAASGQALSVRAREVLLEDLALLARYPGRPPARQLRVPATVLFSPDDPVVPASEPRLWADWCAREPRVVDVGEGGHLFHLGGPGIMDIVERTLSVNASV
ncbi:thioesterase domain-containing protein [Paenarthrobacter sp. NPDC089322]|uniref:thioesterase II family protein n=1 Tax=Paenarthrobacter sp. NPDC089322 TaxID=3155065 RepID=UPI003433A698